MPKIDLKVIKGTENLVLPHIPKRYAPVIEHHPNVSIISFVSEKPSSEFSNILSALSVTDQTTSINLYTRDWRVATVAAGINPSLAYIMCQLAKLSTKDIVLDPFAGAGVIPITALKYFQTSKAFASDISGFAISATNKNSKSAQVSKKLTVLHSSLADLKIKPASVSKIITNPPFGIRSGSHKSNTNLYKELAIKSIKWLKPNGLLVLLTQEIKLVKSAFLEDFILTQEIPLFHHGLRPHIFVYKPK